MTPDPVFPVKLKVKLVSDDGVTNKLDAAVNGSAASSESDVLITDVTLAGLMTQIEDTPG